MIYPALYSIPQEATHRFVHGCRDDHVAQHHRADDLKSGRTVICAISAKISEGRRAGLVDLSPTAYEQATLNQYGDANTLQQFPITNGRLALEP